jgi:predicted HD phosphohydrolase
LRLQGGPYSRRETGAFEGEPFFAGAVALRRWDDAAKVAGLVVPGLNVYRSSLKKALENG